jgi:hypothetical protein
MIAKPNKTTNTSEATALNIGQSVLGHEGDRTLSWASVPE